MILTPTSAELSRGKPNAGSEEKAVILPKINATFAPGIWYDLEVGFHGRTMNFTLKGEHAASFENVRVSGL